MTALSLAVWAGGELGATERLAGQARIIDGDSLEIAGRSIRLDGIDAPEVTQTCTEAGREIRCGRAATRHLRRLIAGRIVTCTGDETDRYDRLIARCRAGMVDLNAAMVRDGHALAFRRYSQAYIAEETAARRTRAGLWAGRFVPPWEHRAGVWESSAQEAPRPSCPIKGNISRDGTRIFHAPGSSSYARTRIDTDRGERWFCSVDEAREAGWRAPRG